MRALVVHLRKSPDKAFGYRDLMDATGMPYDALLYVLHAWAEVDIVQKHEVPNGPGRPKVTFQWSAARVGGTRLAASN